MRKAWEIKKEDKPAQERLASELSISPIVAQLLINRNIKTLQEAENFLKPGLIKLHDPLLLKGVRRAVARIKEA